MDYRSSALFEVSFVKPEPNYRQTRTLPSSPVTAKSLLLGSIATPVSRDRTLAPFRARNRKGATGTVLLGTVCVTTPASFGGLSSRENTESFSPATTNASAPNVAIAQTPSPKPTNFETSGFFFFLRITRAISEERRARQHARVPDAHRLVSRRGY
jgi:hypothetical protein